MSVLYYLVCEECKEKLWIGQGYYPILWIYRSKEKVMGNMEKFLIKHTAHSLRFVSEHECDEPGEYTEFKSTIQKSY